MSAQLSIDFTAAMEARDLGVQRSVEHANAVESEWSGQALGLLRLYVALRDEPFLTEDFRAWAHAAPQSLPQPPDARAFGAVIQRAAKKHRIIERVGAAPAASSHCSLKPTWRRATIPTRGST
jgi:hypothetical protein